MYCSNKDCRFSFDCLTFLNGQENPNEESMMFEAPTNNPEECEKYIQLTEDDCENEDEFETDDYFEDDIEDQEEDDEDEEEDDEDEEDD